MVRGFLGRDPTEAYVEQVLRRLSEGEPPGRIETERVDVKEEPGRRGSGGTVLPGARTNEKAALPSARSLGACAAEPEGIGGKIITKKYEKYSICGNSTSILLLIFVEVGTIFGEIFCGAGSWHTPEGREALILGWSRARKRL